jgi:hypothetical protein
MNAEHLSADYNNDFPKNPKFCWPHDRRDWQQKKIATKQMDKDSH